MIDGAAIKKLREQLGQSQVAFAETLGVHSGTISRWECNVTKPLGPIRKMFERMIEQEATDV